MKKVYISFLLHGNMCYDRYTKQEIREKFPVIYATAVRAMRRFPQVTAHIDFPGLTALSLKHHALWFVNELKPLIDRGQVRMVGCQYAASHAMCSDEESDLVAAKTTMNVLQGELQPDTSTFFNQEHPFHPQMPYIMNQVGAKRLILRRDEWARPCRVRGLEGSEVIVYPIAHLRTRRADLDEIEAFYDAHQDGDFVMIGGDFELLGDIPSFLDLIDALRRKGKIIEWTTVDRYEKEIGVREIIDAPSPFGQSPEDSRTGPSFSRWVAYPEDMVWHGYAVQALEAIRGASFAKLAAQLYQLDEVDVPIVEAWTTEPDNVWDHFFEHVDEYPETEEHYLPFSDGQSTLLSRAWHHALIGLNSDASGWFPWTPRTRHRTIALQASAALATEIIARFAEQVAGRLSVPEGEAQGYVLALNPAPARVADVVLDTPGPATLIGHDGTRIPAVTLFRRGTWSVRARLPLPAYGYALLRLTSGGELQTAQWTTGNMIQSGNRAVSLSDGTLLISEGDQQLEVSVAPFLLSDPWGPAETEEIVPDWSGAQTRVRQTSAGPELEIFAELAWAVWLRLVIGLREGRMNVVAEAFIDMPRRIGRGRYDPEGVMLQFKGRPGSVFYDVPYATIQHENDCPSFVAAQRFVCLEGEETSFGLIALGGNQSFQVVGKEGIVAANLGASTQGRPDTRPECIILPDGTAEHRITSGGDPMLGSYEHRFALLFGDHTKVAPLAHELRTPVWLVPVRPGTGEWPGQKSLLSIEPDTARATAFRTTPEGCQIVVNELVGKESRASCEGASVNLGPYGVNTLHLRTDSSLSEPE